jgi:hypothetical protein
MPDSHLEPKPSTIWLRVTRRRAARRQTIGDEDEDEVLNGGRRETRREWHAPG